MGAIPEDILEVASKGRDALIDRVVEGDDKLLEKYLEGEELTSEEILEALRNGIAAGLVCPVIPVAATKNIGVDRLLDLVLAAPSPKESGSVRVLSGASGNEESESIPRYCRASDGVHIQDNLRSVFGASEFGEDHLRQDHDG